VQFKKSAATEIKSGSKMRGEISAEKFNFGHKNYHQKLNSLKESLECEQKKEKLKLNDLHARKSELNFRHAADWL
jgi:hypothetical protein